MNLLTNKQQKSYENEKKLFICKKSLKINMLKAKYIVKL